MFFQFFSNKVLTFISYSMLIICNEYYSGVILERVYPMYTEEIIDHIGKLYDSIVKNHQNKMKYYGRNEKQLLKNKQEEM